MAILFSCRSGFEVWGVNKDVLNIICNRKIKDKVSVVKLTVRSWSGQSRRSVILLTGGNCSSSCRRTNGSKSQTFLAGIPSGTGSLGLSHQLCWVVIYPVRMWRAFISDLCEGDRAWLYMNGTEWKWWMKKRKRLRKTSYESQGSKSEVNENSSDTEAVCSKVVRKEFKIILWLTKRKNRIIWSPLWFTGEKNRIREVEMVNVMKDGKKHLKKEVTQENTTFKGLMKGMLIKIRKNKH